MSGAGRLSRLVKLKAAGAQSVEAGADFANGEEPGET